MFLEDGTYVSPRRYGELHLLTVDCTNALYKYSVHPMLMSWLYCRPWIKIMSTKEIFHYIFSPLRPSGQLQRLLSIESPCSKDYFSY